MKLRGRLLDTNLAIGLPEIQNLDITSEESWRGFKPIQSDIAQLGAIQIPTIPKSDFGAVGGNQQVLHEVETFCPAGSNGMSASQGTDPLPEEPGIKRTSATAHHEVLQINIEEQMQQVRNSERWKELKEGSMKKQADKAQQAESIVVVLMVLILASILKQSWYLLKYYVLPPRSLSTKAMRD